MVKQKDQIGQSQSSKQSLIPIPIKQCACGNMASEHFDNGLSCGDDQCDDCHAKMVNECRQGSW